MSINFLILQNNLDFSETAVNMDKKLKNNVDDKIEQTGDRGEWSL